MIYKIPKLTILEEICYKAIKKHKSTWKAQCAIGYSEKIIVAAWNRADNKLKEIAAKNNNLD